MMMSFFVLLFAAVMAPTEAQSLAGCPSKCGDVNIPYQFGVGVQPGTSRNCLLDEPFNLTCHKSTLFFRNVAAYNISLQEGQMDISRPVSKVCYNEPGTDLDQSTSSLYAGAFTISNSQNMFMSLGCDTLGIISFLENDLSYSGGCVTLCYTPPPKETNQTCEGSSCGVGGFDCNGKASLGEGWRCHGRRN